MNFLEIAFPQDYPASDPAPPPATAPCAPDLPPADPAPLVCYACRGADFWHSPFKSPTCRRCHPPAPGAEVAK